MNGKDGHDLFAPSLHLIVQKVPHLYNTDDDGGWVTANVQQFVGGWAPQGTQEVSGAQRCVDAVQERFPFLSDLNVDQCRLDRERDRYVLLDYGMCRVYDDLPPLTTMLRPAQEKLGMGEKPLVIGGLDRDRSIEIEPLE